MADAPTKKERSVCFSLFKEFRRLVDIIEMLKGIIVNAPFVTYLPTELSEYINNPISLPKTRKIGIIKQTIVKESFKDFSALLFRVKNCLA